MRAQNILHKAKMSGREFRKNCSNRAYMVHYLYRKRVVYAHIMFGTRVATEQ